jgi:prepilin-type N-terminal cleavage/methylation domain-containing protein
MNAGSGRLSLQARQQARRQLRSLEDCLRAIGTVRSADVDARLTATIAEMLAHRPRPSAQVRLPKAGFTLIEILVVVAIIAVLAGLLLPVVATISRQAKVSQAEQQVRAISAAIVAYGTQIRVLDRQGVWRQRWDWDRDGLIDGDLRADPDAVEAGVTGFCAMTGMTFDRRDRAGRPTDPWRSPYRITYATMIYGAAGFGVWSNGPDLAPATADDVVSWR